MNLYKISKIINKYISGIKDVNIPDVYDCYLKLGESVVGRKFYEFGDALKSQEIFFNKPIIHKKMDCFVGKPKQGFYQQEIICIDYESRHLCVKGNADDCQDIADKIIKEFGIKDFVFDVFYKTGDYNCYLMEINEIHLSSIDSHNLEFIVSQIV